MLLFVRYSLSHGRNILERIATKVDLNCKMSTAFLSVFRKNLRVTFLSVVFFYSPVEEGLLCWRIICRSQQSYNRTYIRSPVTLCSS